MRSARCSTRSALRLTSCLIGAGLGLLLSAAALAGQSAGDASARILTTFGAEVTRFERVVFGLGYLAPGSNDRYAFTYTSRYGRYSAADQLGAEAAAETGFIPGARPLFVALMYGLQGPAPVLGSFAYTRVSAGLGLYLGQSATDPFGPTPARDIGLRVGPELELSFGVRSRTGTLRPWSEVRVGGTWLSGRARLVRPVLSLGMDFPVP